MKTKMDNFNYAEFLWSLHDTEIAREKKERREDRIFFWQIFACRCGVALGHALLIVAVLVACGVFK